MISSQCLSRHFVSYRCRRYFNTLENRYSCVKNMLLRCSCIIDAQCMSLHHYTFQNVKVVRRNFMNSHEHYTKRHELIHKRTFHIAALLLDTIPEPENDALNLLRDIVAALKTDNDYLEHLRFRQSQTLSKERHRLGRSTYKFCSIYPKLPGLFAKNSTMDGEVQFCARQDIIKFLLTEGSTIHYSSVFELLDNVKNHSSPASSDGPKDNDIEVLSRGEALHKVRLACTPPYEDLVNLMLEMAAGLGLQCLVTLRHDLIVYKKYLKSILLKQTTSSDMKASNNDTSTMINQLNIFDSFLHRVLTVQFAPGFLEIRRITYQHSPAATIEKIARYEAVHPLQGLQDLRARLGLRRRVFGLFHPKLVPDYIPAVVLYVSLQDTVPSTMDQIHNQENEVSSDGDIDSDNSLPSPIPTVAAFYSITSLQAGLSGVGLGEYLIKQSVKKLKQEIPSLDTFVTLSPLPNFRKWLQGRANAMSQCTKFSPMKENMSISLGLEPEDLHHLTTSLKCDRKEVLVRLIDALDQKTSIQFDFMEQLQSASHHVNGIPDNKLDIDVAKRVLTRLAARYLVQEKHRGKPLDAVARFHISNGAEVYRINFGADMSRKGWSNSFGIMVNYRYNLPQLLSNQEQYESTFMIPIHDNVKKLLE